MKTKENFEMYESPSVEIIEVEVESGFAATGSTGNTEELEDGGVW